MIPTMETGRPPQLVIVGRQNVGKSTLFNRITNSRRSIVGDYAGLTRDRIRLPVKWQGKLFEVTDTGGMTFFDKEEISALVSERVRHAIEDADHVIFLVDGRTELTPTDHELAQLLRRAGTPVSVAVNKCDTPALDSLALQFSELGFAAIFPISAEHGLGISPLLSATTRGFPDDDTSDDEQDRPIRIAILGRPNVGKSTLLNRLVGSNLAIVSAVPGTTRDAVDAEAIHRNQRFVFVDTAGIRRKSKTHGMTEKLSIVMAQRHLRMAGVALLLVDPLEGVTAQDTRIAGYAHDGGKACIVVVNKWDIVDQAQGEFRRHVREELKMLPYAPVAFVSARTGLRVQSLFPLVKKADRAAQQRIPTSELNRFLAELDMERVTVPGRKPKFTYLTQVATRPPTFLFFGGHQDRLHFGLERYLINQIRDRFGFEGTPIVVRTRTRQRS